MNTYSSWDTVPENLKTRSALKKMGLRLKRGARPVAIKTHWHWKIPDYDLYDITQAVPNIVSAAQLAALEKARAKSLEKRTCTRCGWVEDLSRHYRNKWYVRGGLCPNCLEIETREGDKQEAIEWAKAILQRSDVLIMDTETTDLDGEIIELAIINLQGDTIYNQRFNPQSPISAGALAVHGLTAETLANEPRFADCALNVFAPLLTAGLVVIYNAAFDMAALRRTSRLHGVDMPSIKADCLMEWYAQFCNEWSNYHQSYRYQSLGGDHTALGDCRAALATLHEMANQ